MDKKCLDCAEVIKGRADKKFCSDQCRNNYNNRLNSDANNYVRNVNNILRKNRRILLSLNTTGKAKVPRAKLLEQGFNFGYFTSRISYSNGSTYSFCYEQGFKEIEHDYVLLIVKREYSTEPQPTVSFQ